MTFSVSSPSRRPLLTFTDYSNPSASPGRPLPEHRRKSQGEEGEGEQGRAVQLREGSSSGGGTVQSALGASPTSEGSSS